MFCIKIALFCISGDKNINFKDIHWRLGGIVPPGLSSLKAYINRKNPQLDIKICKNSDEIFAYKPDILGISAVTICYDFAIELAREVKNTLNIPIIIGGHHITCIPETLDASFDVAVIGEGEETFFQLIDSLQQYGKFNSDILEVIDGIAYWKDSKQQDLIKTRPRNLIAELDSLPFIYEEIPFDTELALGIYTSRGCPYRCVFCSAHLHWHDTFREFSAERVIDDLLKISAIYPSLKHIDILDDTFIANKTRLKKIVDLIKQNKLDKRFTYFCTVRANLIDEATVILLKEMGVTLVTFGSESGSTRMLSLLKKNTVTTEDNQRTVDLFHKYSITCQTSIIVGYPGETVVELLQTHEYLMKNKNKLADINICFFQPYPGTEIWNQLNMDEHLKDIVWGDLCIFFGHKYFSIEKAGYYNQNEIHKDEFLSILRIYFSEFLAQGCLDGGKEHYLEIGSESCQRNGFVSLDIHNALQLTGINNNEILGNENQKYKYILVRDSIDRLDLFEAAVVLNNLKKMIAEDGVLHIISCNIEQVSFVDCVDLMEILWGKQQNRYSFKKIGFNKKGLFELLSILGYSSIKEVTGGLTALEHNQQWLEVVAKIANKSECLLPNNKSSYLLNIERYASERIIDMYTEGKFKHEDIINFYQQIAGYLVKNHINDILSRTFLEKEDVPLKFDFSDYKCMVEICPLEWIDVLEKMIYVYWNIYHLDTVTKYNMASLVEKRGFYKIAYGLFSLLQKQQTELTLGGNVGILFHLGWNLYQMGNLVDAKITFEACLEKENNHKKAKSYLMEIEKKISLQK